MTSILRLSIRLVVVRLRSDTSTLVVTLAPASLHTRAAARSKGPARLRKAPEVAHAARQTAEEEGGDDEAEGSGTDRKGMRTLVLMGLLCKLCWQNALFVIRSWLGWPGRWWQEALRGR